MECNHHYRQCWSNFLRKIGNTNSMLNCEKFPINTADIYRIEGIPQQNSDFLIFGDYITMMVKLYIFDHIFITHCYNRMRQ